MEKTAVAVIGAGQAGLAMSHCLAAAGIDHVVLERSSIGSRWRRECAPDGRLLTPNWMTRLPGWRYDGRDPDGFMRFDEVAELLARYAGSFQSPVRCDTEVEAVTRAGVGYVVATSAGTLAARAVVVATGHCQAPSIPSMSLRLGGSIEQLPASDYRGAAAIAPGGVLVIGASASGVQIAEELCREGRDVVLAAGSHTRLPRRYRGRDIMWWLDRSGILEEPTAGSEDIRRPSLQLSGRTDGHAPDLASLDAMGVALAGRAIAIDRDELVFADDLAFNAAAADRRMTRTLDRVDAAIASAIRAGGAALAAPAPRPAPFVPAPGMTRLRLSSHRIATVIWATGYTRSYPWLKIPALDATGEIRQFGGITAVPGLYAIGLNFMRRRKSSFIDGVGRDAADLTAHLARYLAGFKRCAA